MRLEGEERGKGRQKKEEKGNKELIVTIQMPLFLF